VVPGGKDLKVAQAVALSRSKGLADFAEQVGEVRRFASAKPALEAAARTNRLAPLQAAVTRAHLADIDRLAHTNPLSLVPILVFLVRKRREVHTLRAVARGKAAGLSEDRLKELIA
jgi:V/A-type H+-transporting ATPase subunit C